MSSAVRVARRFLATRLQMGPGVVQPKFTETLQGMKKLPAKNRGDLGSAIPSAGYYAQRMKHTMYVYVGNSNMHIIHRVSDKPGEYLDPINNTGDQVISVTPELVVSKHDLKRPEPQPE